MFCEWWKWNEGCYDFGRSFPTSFVFSSTRFCCELGVCRYSPPEKSWNFCCFYFDHPVEEPHLLVKVTKMSEKPLVVVRVNFKKTVNPVRGQSIEDIYIFLALWVFLFFSNQEWQIQNSSNLMESCKQINLVQTMFPPLQYAWNV